jgi:hypothetical protein
MSIHTPHGKVVITCALTGNLTKPEQSPYLPITPREIADSALRPPSEDTFTQNPSEFRFLRPKSARPGAS